jgi:hypothetical protein
MSLATRLLKVTFTFPDGSSFVVDQTMNVRAHIEKNALATQNRADIEITNLNSDRRGQLMTKFTQWRNNQAQRGGTSAGSTPGAYLGLVQVRVEAGYGFTGAPPITTIFVGEVAICDIVDVPPNVTIRATCYTRQCDLSKRITTPPDTNMTYKEYAIWVVNQMNSLLLPGQNQIALKWGLDDHPEIANAQAANFGLPISVGGLIWDLQNYWMPDVAVWVDDEVMYVYAKGEALSTGQVTTVDKFVGVPAWNEWGVDGQCLFLPSLKLVTAVQLQSSMNPTVNAGEYVIMGLTYTLASRDEPFYVRFRAMPPANQ